MRLSMYAIIAMLLVAAIMAPGCGKRQKIVESTEPISRTFDEELSIVCYESTHGLSCVSLSLR